MVWRQRLLPGLAMRGLAVAVFVLLATCHVSDAHGSLEATSPPSPTLSPDVIEK